MPEYTDAEDKLTYETPAAVPTPAVEDDTDEDTDDDAKDSTTPTKPRLNKGAKKK